MQVVLALWPHVYVRFDILHLLFLTGGKWGVKRGFGDWEMSGVVGEMCG